jgi:LysM repeat protein
MKSSTLRRSNLSRERIAVLEELAKNRQKPYDASPGVYVRANKDKELDILWQNFKVNQKEDKSMGVYLATGFIAGAVSMLLITTLLSFSVHKTVETVENADFTAPIAKEKKAKKLTFIPSDSSKQVAVTPKSEAYTVKDGDTLAGIIIRFYGTYDVSKIEKIRQANGMTNPNNLSIGQSLIIPLD